MPTIRPYLSREQAYTGGIQSRATPDAFGAGVGQALEGLGSAAAGLAPILKQKANEAAADQAAAAVSTFDDGKLMIEKRQAAGANPTGLADDVKIWRPDAIIQHLQSRGVTGPAYTRAYRQLMSQQPSVVDQQRNYEIQQTDANGQRLANEGINSLQNQIFSNPDAYDDLIPRMDQQIDLQRNIDPGQRENMKIAGRKDMALNRFKAKLSDADTVESVSAIEKELNSDPWTQRVDAKDHSQLEGIIKSQKNTIQTMADSEATAAVNDLGDVVSTSQSPTPEAIQRAHALGVKSGNPSILNKLAIIDRKIQYINTRGKNPTGILQQELNDKRAFTTTLPVGGLWTGMPVQATGGAPPQAFIIHHTGGSGTVAGVQQTLKDRGLGVQYVMDRDGNITQVGGEGESQIEPGSGAGAGLFNANTVGMEIIAKDDSDITPAQVRAAAEFIQAYYPTTRVMGHGAVNPGHKQATEGQTVVDAIDMVRSGHKIVVPPRYDNSAQLVYTSMRSRIAPFIKTGGDGSIQAAVAAGNIQQESSFRSWALNVHEQAHGQLQWRNERFTNLREFAASPDGHGKSWEDPQVQFDWIMKEGTTGKGLSPGQKAGFDRFLKATTLEEANAGFKAYIGYSDDSEGTRLENSRRIMGGYDQDASGRMMSEDPLSHAGVTQMDLAEQEALDGLIKRNNELIKQGNLMTLWSMQSGQPLSDVSTAEGLQMRLQQAQAAANYNGVPLQDATPFTPLEVTAVTQDIKNDLTGESTLQKLAALGNSEIGKAGAKQIGVTDPGFELLSRLYGSGNDGQRIAASALAGRKFREADKGKTLIAGSVGGLSRSNNQDEALEQEFVSNMGKSLDLRTDRNTIRDEAFNLFVDRFFPHGLGTTEPGKQKWDAKAQAAYKQALQDVMGGHGGTPVWGKVNGEATIMPEGITNMAFDAMLDDLTPIDYALASADNLPPKDVYGDIVAADEIAGHGKFKLVTDDPQHGLLYQVQLADGNFLVSAPGKPYLFVFERVREKAERIMAAPPTTTSELPAADKPFTAGGLGGMEPQIELPPEAIPPVQ